jgi:hypothetical protein
MAITFGAHVPPNLVGAHALHEREKIPHPALARA